MKLKFLKFISLLVIIFPHSIVNGQELIETLPSDNQLFTQGLEFNEAHELILATGKHGESQIGILDPTNGKFNHKASLESKYFGEGITISPQGIWQLTWKEKTVFLRDAKTYKVINSFKFDQEGWGIAYDDQRQSLWMSDGSNKLYERSLDDFSIIQIIEIFDAKQQAMNRLNELEFANGFIYANMWYTQYILKIDPNNGKVVGVFDMSSIIQQTKFTEEEKQRLDVLNGIAHLKDNEFYVTGKYYPVIYHVKLD